MYICSGVAHVSNVQTYGARSWWTCALQNSKWSVNRTSRVAVRYILPTSFYILPWKHIKAIRALKCFSTVKNTRAFWVV
jgi:hypothetical protein